jgi:cytochrome c biogenesis factor
MTLLGQFALWAALVLGLWGVSIAFSGRWRARPELAATVVRSVYAVSGCLLVASIALWKGLISHDFNIEYVAA